MAVNPIPVGYHTLTPYLMVKEAQKFMDFLKKAFDAEIRFVSMHGDSIGHAEIKIGDSMLMLSQANDSHPASPTGLYLYVPDTDAVYKKAIEAGAESVMAPADQFYGDRSGGVKDFAGNYWWIGTHIEDVPEEELKRRMKEEMEKRKK